MAAILFSVYGNASFIVSVAVANGVAAAVAACVVVASAALVASVGGDYFCRSGGCYIFI